ncbi:RidA family protein [Streptomyces sp. NPDC057718]|uniref:RidA family protein n=1 Tax=Streptomyces sp. NPDC057718 TaxID=3346225 RepID=UPI00369C3938
MGGYALLKGLIMPVNRVSPPSLHNPSGRISQVVTVEGARLAHLSGQVAWDTQGRPVGLGDHEAQAVQIAHNLDAASACARCLVCSSSGRVGSSMRTRPKPQ